MSKTGPTPDKLFDRPWRWGHPFARRTSRFRRWAMTALLLLLCAVIYTYSHITDATRVREMAESYLSELLGGRVVVGSATLSVFEGLRLDEVEVHVDAPAPEGQIGPPPPTPDSLLFSAKTFIIKYDPKVMLGGTLEATQIIVQKPHVHLTENVDTGAWNWHRIARRRPRRGRPTVSPSAKPRLPEILLRNARVEFNEIRGGRFRPLAYMAADGQLAPSTNGERYNFELQSRGSSEMGPSVSGWVSLGRGQVSAKLLNFSFGHDVRSMLPADVRGWWERHNLSGRLDIPVLSYTPARENQSASFRVETVIVDGVSLSVHAEEWMSASEVRRLERTREAVAMVRDIYRLGGYRLNEPAARKAVPPAPPRDASRREAEARQVVRQEYLPAAADRLAAMFEPDPLQLENVAGKLVFTQDGISIENFSGRVDNNGLKISGRIEGYSPNAPVALKVTSFATENITIPASPRYISSLPRQVREFYEQLRPEGTCRLTVEVNRRTRDDRPEVSGQLDIINGKFLYSKFPYPLREVTGRISFGRDPQSGEDKIEIRNIRGRGLENGPNRNTLIAVDGEIGPLGPNTGVDVRVEGTDVSSEEALRLAFPPEVRTAISIFDPSGKGEFPKYRGRFLCHIVRPVGPRTRWSFDTDVTLEDASGRLEAFPYPLEHVAGELKIRSGHVDIVNTSMKRGNASLLVNGRVSWGRDGATTRPAAAGSRPAGHGATEQATTVVTNLTLHARNVPIDADLLAALPPERREWLEKVGVSGLLDIDGRITQGIHGERGRAAEKPPLPRVGAAQAEPGTNSGPPLEYDLDLTVREGSVWPAGGTFAVSGVSGKMRISPDSMEILELKGRRGGGEITGRGRAEWNAARPRVRLSAGATNLALEPSLFAALPEGARKAWEEVQPKGSIDVDLTYESDAAGIARESAGAAKQRAATATVDASSLLSAVDVIDLTAPPAPRPAVVPHGLRVVIKPHDLSLTLKSVPYRLDKLSGTVTVLPDKVVLEDLAGQHGNATVKVAGTGMTGPDGVWDLKLAGHDLEVNDELKKALPPGLTGIMESLELGGRIGFMFPRFVYRPGETNAAATKPAVVPPSQANAPKPPGDVKATEEGGADIDLGGSITLSKASLDVGVPLKDVEASINLRNLSVRQGVPEVADGDIVASSMSMGGRVLRDFHADVAKPAGKPELRLDRMEAKTCGGIIGGTVNLLFPDDAPSRYALNLAVRNVDVAQLAQENEAEVKGQLTASLALEGAWGGLSERRGRGDLTVAGRGMVRVPIVLGLMQVTNLAVPLSGPFSEATARYSVEGQRIVFENMELRSDTMVMSGDGQLDFGTMKVRLNFITDNPRGLKVPFLNDLLQGARQELMKIHVRGTIQEPKVSAGMMNTFTTTIDEVMRGDPPPPRQKRR